MARAILSVASSLAGPPMPEPTSRQCTESSIPFSCYAFRGLVALSSTVRVQASGKVKIMGRNTQKCVGTD